MNKKQQILFEAKRLFGRYGYLGFTLKQLAQACEMTSPALYYFYSSKADLFKDCLLSELDARRVVTRRCIEQSNSLTEFAGALAQEAIDVCDVASFRTGQAMQEIIHLPEEMQQELQAAWDTIMIKPVEDFLERIHPNIPEGVSYYLLGTYLIYIATFCSAHANQFSRDVLEKLFISAVSGMESPPSLANGAGPCTDPQPM